MYQSELRLYLYIIINRRILGFMTRKFNVSIGGGIKWIWEVLRENWVAQEEGD
jgi:hypothetical protein